MTINSFLWRIVFIMMLGLSLMSCENKKAHYNGYIDADLLYISSDFSGKIEQVYAHKGQYIAQYQPLFRLEKETQTYALGASQANTRNFMDNSKALLSQLQYAKKNYHRLFTLHQQNSASEDEVELAAQSVSVLEQQFAAMNAQIKASHFDQDEKQWQLNTRQGDAPESGILFDRYYHQGEFVQSGQPIFSLITADNIKVIFFVPENNLSHIALNQPIRLLFDGTQKTQTATIQYISNEAEYTSPIIFSSEEREQLVYRIEAKFKTVDLNKVHLGQPVSIELIP